VKGGVGTGRQVHGVRSARLLQASHAARMFSARPARKEARMRAIIP